MNLSESDRDFFLDLAFFEPSAKLLDLDLRPLSLCSYKFLQLAGLSLLEPDADLSLLEETQQIAFYLWLHAEPIPDVTAALWTGDWKSMLEGFETPSVEVIAAFRPYRARLLAAVHAAGVRIRPYPKSKGDDTPKDVIGPSDMAFKVSLIMRETGLDEQYILWHLWLPRALQYYHAGLRWHRFWTVPPATTLVEEEFEDTVPDCLRDALLIDKATPKDERGTDDGQ